jgi:membrane fusion protein, multidrug efflux system
MTASSPPRSPRAALTRSALLRRPRRPLPTWSAPGRSTPAAAPWKKPAPSPARSSPFATAKAAESQALANRTAAVGALDANQVLTTGAGVADNPEVVAARARYEKARLQLERTVIRAPVTGVVTGRQVQVGQRIQPGANLMTVVPVQDAFVDANFKEGQLAKVKPGQKVELVSDLYGDKVKFHGTVVGMSGGTGSAFALIPAQNATGNWIKVVQRVPVRIRLDAQELKAHPLRVGLSMEARIKLS